MVTCEWARSLTQYDCRSVPGLNGEPTLEIGTPFSLPDGTPICLYVVTLNTSHVLISDNGDTLFHLNAMGIDVWQSQRLRAIRETIAREKLTLNDRGDFQCIAQVSNAPLAFAQAITGLLGVSRWAHEQLNVEEKERDISAEAEPYIIARNPGANFERHFKVRGASKADHEFAFRHGRDVIDVISPTPQGTGGVMRKVGDVLNGPFAEDYSPLIIVDDRFEPTKAEREMGIIASMVRAQPFSMLMRAVH